MDVGKPKFAWRTNVSTGNFGQYDWIRFDALRGLINAQVCSNQRVSDFPLGYTAPGFSRMWQDRQSIARHNDSMAYSYPRSMYTGMK